MTFDEALEIKKSIGNTIMEKDMQLWVFVTPENEEDFHRYLTAYRSYKRQMIYQGGLA